MSEWDIVSKVIDKGFWVSVAVLLAVVLVVFVANPDKAEKWNTIITTWIAHIVPKKRKQAFKKNLRYSIDTACEKFDEENPHIRDNMLPYKLDVEWVEDDEKIEAIKKDKQIIVFVPSYRDQSKQIIGVLHNYCSTGFAEKAKVYMSNSQKEASDLIMTEKLVKNAGPAVFDYYNREYIPVILSENRSFKIAYENLKKIDRDGLFLPIYINEIDKLANAIYPQEPTDQVCNLITDFGNFILRIVNKKKDELVDLIFHNTPIHVLIVLAVSDQTTNIMPIIQSIEKHIKFVNTIYILASGSKIKDARAISCELYRRNTQELYDPVNNSYIRYTHNIQGVESICIEIPTLGAQVLPSTLM